MLGSMTVRMLNGKEDTGLYLGALAPRLTGRFVGEAAFFISGQENQKMKENIYVKLLKGARLKIASGESDFVCNAIKAASWDMFEMFCSSVALRIVQWIEASIAPHTVVTSWLREGAGICLFSEGAATRYRLEWIDQMIPIVAEWEEPCA